jgi:hypothetical protein
LAHGSGQWSELEKKELEKKKGKGKEGRKDREGKGKGKEKKEGEKEGLRRSPVRLLIVEAVFASLVAAQRRL